MNHYKYKIEFCTENFFITETYFNFKMVWSDLQICRTNKIYSLYTNEAKLSLKRCQEFILKNYPELLI